VENGVDCQLFEHPDPRFSIDLSGYPRPRLGYVGVINQKVDLGVLAALADEFSGGTILLVGRDWYFRRNQDRRYGALLHRSNVRVLPPVHPFAVPSVLSQLDVGLAPYNRNTWAEVGSPLKVYEYLAAGIPAIVTDTAGVRSLRNVVTIVRRRDDWIQVTRQVLRMGDGATAAERRREARNHDWSHRCRQIAECLERSLVARERLVAASPT
jgi:glycosyltransferase involved in cell wall biosynthesis